jgi:hypothetical protein
MLRENLTETANLMIEDVQEQDGTALQAEDKIQELHFSFFVASSNSVGIAACISKRSPVMTSTGSGAMSGSEHGVWRGHFFIWMWGVRI